ncbi:MAG: S8 family serine peptidase, partial [Opitutales bacterium]|nr:S8 family serine peptidase [Opitutales bacterium]
MKKTMFLRILSIAWLTMATAFLAAGQLHSQPRILGVCDELPDEAALASAGVKVESWLPATGVCVMELIDTSSRVESVLVDLSLLDIFETLELDSTLQAQRMPSDPLFPEQWALRDASENGAGLGIASAWDTTVGSQAVVVGVVDTGMDASHPDLLHNLFINPYEIGGNGVDDDANGYVDDILGVDVISGSSAVADASGHGTHVAGIIGAAGDNVLGISGVNWQVSLLAVKAFDANGQGLVSDVLKGYEYLLGMKAAGVNLRVVNNSFASPVWSAALERGVRSMALADVFMVFAAGDSGLDLDKGGAYPAAYAGVYGVTVGSMDASGALAAKSNYGANTVEMMAPGEGIVSTLPNGQYGEMSGSSMAAAHVSGVAALLMATDETLPASALKGVMKGEGSSTEGPVALNAKGSLESLAAWQALDIKPVEEIPSFTGESTLQFADAPVKVMDLPPNGQGLPAGAVFDPATRTFTWTPTVDQVGDHQITFWVSDGIDEDSETITITVTPAAEPPAMVSPVDGATLSGSSQEFTWTANGAAVTNWFVRAGNAQGDSSYFLSGTLSGETLTTNVTGLPTDGSSVWVRLQYRVGGVW